MRHIENDTTRFNDLKERVKQIKQNIKNNDAKWRKEREGSDADLSTPIRAKSLSITQNKEIIYDLFSRNPLKKQKQITRCHLANNWLNRDTQSDKKVSNKRQKSFNTRQSYSRNISNPESVVNKLKIRIYNTKSLEIQTIKTNKQTSISNGSLNKDCKIIKSQCNKLNHYTIDLFHPKRLTNNITMKSPKQRYTSLMVKNKLVPSSSSHNVDVVYKSKMNKSVSHFFKNKSKVINNPVYITNCYNIAKEYAKLKYRLNKEYHSIH